MPDVPAPAQRVQAFDLARGLAVLFMVAVHVLQTFATPEVYDSPFGWAIDFLGGPPAAPVFVFLMGAVLAFSRHAGTWQLVRRGVLLLALAYALNALRGSLPVWIALQAGVPASDLGGTTPIRELLIVDILHFAGMACLLLAIVRRLTQKPWVWIVLAASIATVSPWIWGTMSGWPPLDFVLTLLWGMGDEAVAFPVFSWLVFPLVGMAVGKWLDTSSDPGQTLRRAAWAGAGLLLVGGVLTVTDVSFHLGDYWRTGPGGLMAIAGFVLFWVWLCDLVAAYVLPTAVGRILAFWSRHVTAFYFIHWVLIGWSVLLVGYEVLGIPGTLIGMLAILAASDLLTRIWIWLLTTGRKGPSHRTGK